MGGDFRGEWVGKMPWGREWQPTPVSLPGEFHGQRSLAGFSPWGRKELDMIERLSTHNLNEREKTKIHPARISNSAKENNKQSDSS